MRASSRGGGGSVLSVWKCVLYEWSVVRNGMIEYLESTYLSIITMFPASCKPPLRKQHDPKTLQIPSFPIIDKRAYLIRSDEERRHSVDERVAIKKIF